MASQPLLQQPDVDLEAGQAGQAAQAAQAAEADDEPPARIAAYTGTFLGIPYARIINFVKELDLSYRPGYGRSLRSRRGLRLWLLPAVAMAHVVAEGCSRGFTMDVAHENFYFLSLFLAATLAPLFLDPSWVPDILMASAAAEHTWRNAMKVLGTAKPGSAVWIERDILSSEHLFMFWIVALPTLAGGELFGLASYTGALLAMHFLTGVPGWGCFAAGAWLLVPVIASEIHSAEIFDEAFRSRTALKLLLSGTGGGWCTVDYDTGCILEASPALQSHVGCIGEGTRLTELVRLPQDKEYLEELVTFCHRWVVREATNSRQFGVVTGKELEAIGKRLELRLSPIKVTSLRATRAPQGVVAKIVPFEVNSYERVLRVWVEVNHFHQNDWRVELSMRDQCVTTREREVNERQHSVECREGHALALIETLDELNAQYKFQINKEKEKTKAVNETSGSGRPAAGIANLFRRAFLKEKEEVPDSSSTSASSVRSVVDKETLVKEIV